MIVQVLYKHGTVIILCYPFHTVAMILNSSINTFTLITFLLFGVLLFVCECMINKQWA